MEIALSQSPKAIGILATEATVNSNSFPIELKKIGVDVPIYQQACPKLVPLIEASAPLSILDPLLRSYIQPLLDKGIDTLILGCTHYGLISSYIRDIVGPNITIIGEGKETAIKLKDYLQRHNEIEANLAHDKKRDYFITKENPDYTDLFCKIMSSQDINIEVSEI
jgi:glutamate racemase